MIIKSKIEFATLTKLKFIFKRPAIEDSLLLLEFLLNEALVRCQDGVKRRFKVVFKMEIKFYDNSYVKKLFALIIASKSLFRG